MARPRGWVRLPAYVRATKRASGETAYYWELPPWARPTRAADGTMIPAVRDGRRCALTNTALGTDLAVAITKGEALNQALAHWRTGEGGIGMAKGTVEWLFAWYREQERFKKNVAKTRTDYRKLMDMLVAFEPKAGAAPLGKRMASKVDAGVADKLYRKLRERGERQATYAMQVCRLVWTWAARHHRITGVKENPFAGMGLKSTAAKGNRATTRTEYDLYRATARAMGYQSMATAAALAFECCQRVWDVFGFEDADGVEHRGIAWAGYQPGEQISLIQSKTGNAVVLPLMIDVAGEGVHLYPDLEAELRRTTVKGDTIVVEERSGQKYKERRVSSVHRAICVQAGLPKDMTFTGFRHGGITEVGSVSADVRPISGHATLDVTRIYNKATADKAREIAAARRAHIIKLGEDLSESRSEHVE
jgi:site-specific recombinase XerC